MDKIVLDHLAFGVPDPAPAAELLVGCLGARPRSSGPGGGAFLWWQFEFEGGGALELIVPHGPPGGFVHRFLEARGPGPHHLTFKVSSVAEAIVRAEALGYTPVGFDDSDPGWIEAFLHPKQAMGIVVQLAEEHLEVYGEDNAEWVRPPFPKTSEPANPVRPLGVLLRAQSEERARRQWGELLGGDEEKTERGLRFRWPDSPLRVDVVIDAGAEEGPLALELSAPESLGLPEAKDPLLGTALRQREDAHA